MSAFMDKVRYFQWQRQRDIADLQQRLRAIERHLEVAYHTYLQNMIEELKERQASYDGKGHVLSYRHLYRLNHDVIDPEIQRLESGRELLIAQLINITPPAALMLHFSYVSWALYMMLKEKHNGINAHTELQFADYAPGPEIRYGIPQEPAWGSIYEITVKASMRTQVGTAHFDRWGFDGQIIGAFAYAPEINTLFYK